MYAIGVQLKKVRSLLLAGAANFDELYVHLRLLEPPFQTSVKDLRYVVKMQSVDEDFKDTGWVENESRNARVTWITERVGKMGVIVGHLLPDFCVNDTCRFNELSRGELGVLFYSSSVATDFNDST